MDIWNSLGTAIIFRHDELADSETNEVTLATGFASRLVQLREAFDKPMSITGPVRTLERNVRIGGHPRSLHVYDVPNHGLDGACALDIWVGNALLRTEFVKLALDMGWSVGVAAKFTHLDRRDLAGMKQAIFGYPPRS